MDRYAQLLKSWPVSFEGRQVDNVISRVRLPGALDDAALGSLSMPLKVVLGDRDVFFGADTVAHRISALAPTPMSCAFPMQAMVSLNPHRSS